MNAKEYLLQIEKYDKIINNRLAEIQHYKEMATSTTAYISNTRVQKSGTSDRVSNSVAAYTDLEEQLNLDIVNAMEAKQDIIKTIELLPVDEYDLLYKRYVQGYTLYEVVDLMDKSYSWVTSTQKKALDHLQQIIQAAK